MKITFLKTKSFFLVLLVLLFFEFFSYFLSHRDLFSWYITEKGVWYFVLFGIILIVASYLWLVTDIGGGKNKIIKFIPFTLSVISIFLFLFSFPVFFFHQIIIFISLPLFIFLFLNIEKKDVRFRFINVFSFFSASLLFFGIYSLTHNFFLPYWLSALAVITFSSLLLYYKLYSLDVAEDYRNFYLLLLSIIITEIFLISLFWPIHSLFLKSLLLVIIYYLYWGIIDSSLRQPKKKFEWLIYVIVFISIVALVVFSLFIKEIIR